MVWSCVSAVATWVTSSPQLEGSKTMSPRPKRAKLGVLAHHHKSPVKQQQLEGGVYAMLCVGRNENVTPYVDTGA